MPMITWRGSRCSFCAPLAAPAARRVAAPPQGGGGAATGSRPRGGAEPSHACTSDDASALSCAGGYERRMLREARARNPAILLSGGRGARTSSISGSSGSGRTGRRRRGRARATCASAPALGGALSESFFGEASRGAELVAYSPAGAAACRRRHATGGDDAPRGVAARGAAAADLLALCRGHRLGRDNRHSGRAHGGGQFGSFAVQGAAAAPPQ